MPRGLTILELLVTLAIAGLMLSLALPSFEGLIARQRSVAAANAIIGTVALARTVAITQRAPAVFCPNAGGRCGARGDWADGGLVFVDRNRNAQLDADEAVLGALPALRSGETLEWRSFRNRSYLSFLPTGITPWQNGHFLYCPASRKPELARQIILNAQGRTRLARDQNGDGVAEDARGRPLQCR